VQFDVADFVPQRLKVTLTAETKIVHPGETLKVRSDSRFLYGAPASGLSGEGTAKIQADSDPFPDFKLYQFGRVDDTFAVRRRADDRAGNRCHRFDRGDGSGRRSRRYHLAVEGGGDDLDP
jgi:uncharacterized protein YfaS (alpha-2-macroglobulin family)